MQKPPKIIGEGSYGCVHSPSLTCNDDGNEKIDYENKVSKILSVEEARKELKEYVFISEADKENRFFLGEPETCIPKSDSKNRYAFAQCKMAKNVNLSTLDKKYKLLIMKNGGMNLTEYADKMKKQHNTSENTEKIKRFWIEVKRLFLGIQTFLKHDIIHHDLKPHNIVYDEEKVRLNFIDFGLMEKKSTSIRECKENRYWMNKNHWSFPFETNLVCKKHWNVFNNKYEYDKIKEFEQFTKMVFRGKMEFVDTFFSFVLQSKTDEEEVSRFMDDYLDFILEFNNDDYISKHGFLTLETQINRNYLVFLEKYFQTIDIYGTGIALLYVLKNVKHLINREEYKLFYKLFYSMVHPNIYKRIQIDDLIDEYDTILHITGILKKTEQKVDDLQNNRINNNREIIRELIPDDFFKNIEERREEIMENSDVTPVKSNTLSSKSINVKQCPDGKVINPATGRCIKVKLAKNKTVKQCPDGKVLNPATGRCIKVKLAKNKTVKQCPDGKVINPATGRCIKVKLAKNQK
jgi:serine/threonine protein kinase